MNGEDVQGGDEDGGGVEGGSAALMSLGVTSSFCFFCGGYSVRIGEGPSSSGGVRGRGRFAGRSGGGVGCNKGNAGSGGSGSSTEMAGKRGDGLRDR